MVHWRNTLLEAYLAMWPVITLVLAGIFIPA
jgi:hypothetical protein